MKTIVITTKAIGVNRLYRGRRFLTKEGKETKEAYAWEIALQWKKEVVESEDVAVNIIFYYSKRRPDIDGGLKALLDSMEQIIYKNDNQISELHVYRQKDEANPRIEVSIL